MGRTKHRPRRGPGYPVKPDWQENVRKRLEKLDMTEKDLAKKIRCAQSTIHDTLHNPEARHSSLIPDIHAAIGWDPPPDPGESPPLPSPDAIEMGHLFDRLPEPLRKKLRDDAKMYIDLVKRAGGNLDEN